MHDASYLRHSVNALDSVLIVTPPLTTIILVVVGIGLFLRLWRKGWQLQDALALVVYLPKRRTYFAALFVALSVAMLLNGIIGSLGESGALSPLAEDGLELLTNLTGAVALFLLIWLVLVPKPAAPEERVTLDGQSARLYALGVIDRDEERR